MESVCESEGLTIGNTIDIVDEEDFYANLRQAAPIYLRFAALSDV